MQYYYVIAEKRDGRTGTGKFRMVTTYHHNELKRPGFSGGSEL